MPQRVVLYLRLSSADDASTSIARQRADLLARAEREGWEVVATFVDDGVSGAKSRAHADEALAHLRDRRAEVLAVWKFDRWSRQGLPALAALIEVLDAVPGTLFVADRDGLSSTQPAWRIIASVLAEVARMERENTRERVLSSLHALRTSGRYAGGQRPYGYVSAPNPDGPGRILVPEPAEAAVVREAARRVLAGETPYAIAHDFNAREIPAKNGGRWAPTVLRDLLQRDAITGRVLHRGELVRGPDGLPVQLFEPVLDVELWHRLRVVLDGNGIEGRVQRRRAARLLSGILRCASCGARMYVRPSGRGYTSYVCQGRADGRDCVGVSVNADRIEEHVTRAFLDEVGDVEVYVREEAEDPTLAAEVAEVARAIEHTSAALTEDEADIATLLARLAFLKTRRASLRAAQSAAPGIRYVGTGQTYADAWEGATDAERRALLAPNVAVLTVGKGRRGHKGLDPARVTLVAQPAHPLGEHPSATPARPAI